MNTKTYKIAVVGNRDLILPFHMIGFQIFPVIEAQEATNTLRQLAKANFGIIYVTEDIAQLIPETIARYDKELTPAIILLPSYKQKERIALNRLQERVERAVGQNIL
ncbi:V-type H+-transporting ATPase subunit F [Streptococcus porcinus]|uniref:V-type ATP synthase subunit F n=1 Tax=Streptococcus porcinus TaxID=1340 RepID=UPI0010CAB762|nr:V-type ATP synthase subunit F [Streptococcus porcinus]VTS16161.1 V-type H+-transporting ATPase subunit F [Streptococcus porcinus]